MFYFYSIFITTKTIIGIYVTLDYLSYHINIKIKLRSPAIFFQKRFIKRNKLISAWLTRSLHTYTLPIVNYQRSCLNICRVVGSVVGSVGGSLASVFAARPPQHFDRDHDNMCKFRNRFGTLLRLGIFQKIALLPFLSSIP